MGWLGALAGGRILWRSGGTGRVVRLLAALIAAGGGGGNSLCGGQEEAVVEVGPLPPYVVTATRTERALNEVPAAVSRIDAAAIQRANRQITLDESLQAVPGVFVLNPYNYAQDTRIAIRGSGARSDFGIRGIRLVVDGIPATTPDGQGEVDGLDLGSAGRIEVLRGPSSALYGSASGGVIRIETESGPSVPFLETRWSGGEDGFFNAQFKAGGRDGPLSYLLSGSHLLYDGYRDHSETDNTRLNGKLEYRLDEDARLRLVFNLIDFPEQNDPGGLTRAEAEADPRQARRLNLDFDGGESVEQQRVGLVHLREFDEARSLESRVYYTHPSGFFGGWRTRLVGAFHADDANEERIEAYSVSELRLGYEHRSGNWTVAPYLGVNNVLDEDYFSNVRINAFGGRYFEPAPERSLFGGVRVRYRFE